MNSKYSLPLLMLVSGTLAVSPSYADDSSSIEKAGSVVAVAIPAIAYGSTYYKDDKEGRQQFYRGFGTTVATTYALKAVIDKERPNGEDDNSFPSGHASAAFQGASFIHRRYGLEYSIPAYLGAGFVGYRMMDSGDHWASDVVFGAVLGWIVGHHIGSKQAALEIAGFEVVPFTYTDNENAKAGVYLVKKF